MTFAHLADEAVEWADTPQSGYSPGWARQVDYLLKAHSERWGTMQLASITPAILGKWADSRGTEVAGKTLANEIHALRAAFKLAVARQYLPSDPSAALKIPKARATRPKFLTDDQIKLLLECATEADAARLQPRQSSNGGHPLTPGARPAQAMKRFYNVDGTFDTARLRFLLLTALRKSQLTSLTWSQYDVAQGTITLESRPDHTEKSHRVTTIPLPVEAREIIQGQPRRGKFIFPNLDGGRDTEIASRFKRIAARMVAKGGAHVHLHLLRHTALTLFLQHTHDIAAVQAYAGHATIATTQRYAWVLPSTLKSLTEGFTFKAQDQSQSSDIHVTRPIERKA
jgi:integrase